VVWRGADGLGLVRQGITGDGNAACDVSARQGGVGGGLAGNGLARNRPVGEPTGRDSTRPVHRHDAAAMDQAQPALAQGTRASVVETGPARTLRGAGLD
jgi:hypothetical protein